MCSGWVDLQSKASHQPPTPGQMWGEKCYYDPVMWGETAKKVEIQPVIRGGALGRRALKKKKKKQRGRFCRRCLAGDERTVLTSISRVFFPHRSFFFEEMKQPHENGIKATQNLWSATSNRVCRGCGGSKTKSSSLAFMCEFYFREFPSESRLNTRSEERQKPSDKD